MQIPSNIPKPTVPAQETKVEPVARIAPVVMGDAAMRIDPSVLLKVPVPVSQGPRTTHTVRQSLDHSGPIYVSPEEAEDSEAAAYIAALRRKPARTGYPGPCLRNLSNNSSEKSNKRGRIRPLLKRLRMLFRC